MNNKEHWINKLNLLAHPEGGYYSEVYRSKSILKTTQEGSNEFKIRASITSIYFLLAKGDKSHFHILTSDEIWYYHVGTTATIHFISTKGEYYSKQIGPESMQVVIPKNTHFAAEINSDSDLGYLLVGCAVAPGFDFQDFRLSTLEELVELAPSKKNLIANFTL